MTIVRKLVVKFVSGSLTCLAVAGFASRGNAQTVLDSLNDSARSFTYSNDIFTVSNCTYTVGAGSPVDCDGTAAQNAEIVAAGNGRSGTAFEIAPASGSSVYASAPSQEDYNLSFNLSVAPTAASNGISSITNTVSGTSQNPDDATSVSFAVTGVSPAFSTQSNLQSPSASFSWTPTTTSPDSDSFNISLNVAGNPTSVLVLNSAGMLFNPAPEPSAIAPFVTGIFGLIVARRKTIR
jgi:hypothetical protein